MAKKEKKQRSRRIRTKSDFQKAKSTEAEYNRALRGLAAEVGKIIKAFGDITPEKLPRLSETLRKYAEVVTPWAESKAELMVAQADRQDRRAWYNASQNMSLAMREQIRSTPVGETMRGLMKENVVLIKSLPIKAAERVHKLVIENVSIQGRSAEIAKEIARSGEVTKSRATLIARTEVARASSILTESRATHVGSEGYIWRTVHDSDVRHSHAKLDGKFVRWDDPPTTDGLTYHAGQGPNCRCFAEPVIPQELFDD